MGLFHSTAASHELIFAALSVIALSFRYASIASSRTTSTSTVTLPLTSPVSGLIGSCKDTAGSSAGCRISHIKLIG